MSMSKSHLEKIFLLLRSTNCYIQYQISGMADVSHIKSQWEASVVVSSCDSCQILNYKTMTVACIKKKLQCLNQIRLRLSHYVKFWSFFFSLCLFAVRYLRHITTILSNSRSTRCTLFLKSFTWSAGKIWILISPFRSSRGREPGKVD